MTSFNIKFSGAILQWFIIEKYINQTGDTFINPPPEKYISGLNNVSPTEED